jgi:hypothetical protein
MHYRIVEPADQDAARMLKDVLAWLANDREMQRDRERFSIGIVAPRSFRSAFGAHRDRSL